MNIIVTGVRGQLGYDIMRELEKRGISAAGLSSDDMDIRDRLSVDRAFDTYKPDLVIHPAAWTRVDDAEDHEEEVRKVNVTGSKNMAEACKKYNARLMYFSTDYIFNGRGDKPHAIDETPDPIGVYGKTKLEGEEVIRQILPAANFILRLQWVYGINGSNFVKTMLRLAKDRDKLSVVSDQIGSPSYTVDIAKCAVDIALSAKVGTYHVANTGYASWYEFAKAIFKKAGIDIAVEPVATCDYPTKARRPLNSRFDTRSLTEAGFSPLPNWEDALDRFMLELEQKGELDG